MSFALWLLIATITITAAAHIPVRGRSVRDILRRSECGELRGLRLTPGLRNQLTAADIIALADDSPVTIDALCFYQLTPEIRGEHAHRYFRAAQRYVDSPVPWTHVVVTLPAVDEGNGQGNEALNFLIHRLGLLGIRARLLTEDECAQTVSAEAAVQLRRTGRSRHVAALGRKPHLWLTRQRDVTVTSGPAQVIGVGASGQTITMCPADVPHMRVRCGDQDICELLIGTLSLGYRVGIRTSRPQYFTVALELGAVLIPRLGDQTVDVVVIDEYEPDLQTGSARIIEVVADATFSVANDAAAATPAASTSTEACPALTMGEFTWTLSTARTTAELRPLTMRVATASAVTAPAAAAMAPAVATTARGLEAADPVVAGRHLVPRPGYPAAQELPGMQGHHPGRLARQERLADRLLQESRLPSASVRR